MTRYALLVEGYQRKFPGPALQLLGWYWGALSGMRDILIEDYGYSRKNITLLFQEPNGEGIPGMRESASASGTGCSYPLVDGISTKKTLEDVLESLADKSEADDELFCYFVDHGHYDGISSHFQFQDGTITDIWLREKAERIKAERQVWIFTQCQSGGFANNMFRTSCNPLSRPGNRKNIRIVLTSTLPSENNKEAFAEPVRDGFRWKEEMKCEVVAEADKHYKDIILSNPPTVADAYNHALDSVWTIFREGHRKSEPLNEHCLINSGTDAVHSRLPSIASFQGRIVVVEDRLEMRFPYVYIKRDANKTFSLQTPQPSAGIRYELVNISDRDFVFGPAGIFAACRGPDGSNRDFGHVKDVVIKPRRSYLFEAEIELKDEGVWQIWPSFQLPDLTWCPRVFSAKVKNPPEMKLSPAENMTLGNRKLLWKDEKRKLYFTAFWQNIYSGPQHKVEITLRVWGEGVNTLKEKTAQALFSSMEVKDATEISTAQNDASDSIRNFRNYCDNKYFILNLNEIRPNTPVLEYTFDLELAQRDGLEKDHLVCQLFLLLDKPVRGKEENERHGVICETIPESKWSASDLSKSGWIGPLLFLLQPKQ
ncbi:MAG: hypothetical protein QW728_00800 [Thermoplasmata archaeon]